MKNNKIPSPFKATRIRLIISIPVIVFLFSFSSGMLVLYLDRHTVLREPPAMLAGTLWVLAMAGVALFCGVLLALGITKPLKEMKHKGEEILALLPFATQYSEVDELFQVFNQMIFSLSKFFQDHQIIENLPEGLIALDPAGTITSANRIAEEIFGLDLHGLTYQESIPIHSTNITLLECIAKSLSGEQAHLPREIRFRNIHGQVSSLWVSCFPFKDKNDMAISIKDMKELRHIRKQIRQTESLAELGTLASILSHEIRNPLGSIRGLLELINEGFSADEPRKTYVDRIVREVDRLTHITENLLDLIRLDDEDVMNLKEPLNLNDLLRHVLSLNQYEFQNKKISVVEKYEDKLPLIKADSEKLIQVFVNLTINAFQAEPEGGRISVTTAKLPSGISIRIHNSGSYIPPEDRASIFLPAYSTKQHGSGFGLFLAQRIIGAHHGTLEVRSEPEEGTTFCIEFPLNDKGGRRVR